METDKYYLQPFPSIILSHCTNLCVLSTTFVKIEMSAPSVNYFTSFSRCIPLSRENLNLANLSISVQYSILDMRITVTREAKFTRSLTWKHNVSFRKRKKKLRVFLHLIVKLFCLSIVSMNARRNHLLFKRPSNCKGKVVRIISLSLSWSHFSPAASRCPALFVVCSPPRGSLGRGTADGRRRRERRLS